MRRRSAEQAFHLEQVIAVPPILDRRERAGLVENSSAMVVAIQCLAPALRECCG